MIKSRFLFAFLIWTLISLSGYPSNICHQFYVDQTNSGSFPIDKINSKDRPFLEDSIRLIKTTQPPPVKAAYTKEENIEKAIWVSHYIRGNLDRLETLHLPWLASDVSLAIQEAELNVKSRVWSSKGRKEIEAYFKQLKYELKDRMENKSLTHFSVGELFEKASLPTQYYLSLIKHIRRIKDVKSNIYSLSGTSYTSLMPQNIPWYTTQVLSIADVNRLFVYGAPPIWHPMKTTWIDGRLRTSMETAFHDWAHALSLSKDVTEKNRDFLIKVYESIQRIENQTERSATEIAFFYEIHERKDYTLQSSDLTEFGQYAHWATLLPEAVVNGYDFSLYPLIRFYSRLDLRDAIPREIRSQGRNEVRKYLNKGRTSLNALAAEVKHSL